MGNWEDDPYGTSQKKLSYHKDIILPIWFNAWRYEREEHFAIIALMKTIAYAMADHPIYREIRPIVIRSLKIIAKGLLEGLAAKFLGEKTIDDLKKEENILPYVEFLTQFDKDTIYFDGIHNIEKEMEKILDKNKHPDSRIVVFIDDLDRCSPKRALEVFESVKVFLDIKGFVFVIGLSHETVAKLITAEYQASEIKGEEYIRKIIQIPIILPSWNQVDAKDIITNLLVRNKIDKTYLQIIKEHKELIATVVEPIPREVKRFINSFLISYRIYSNSSSIKPKELLLIQAIKFRWYDFYKSLSSDEEFRNLIRELVVQFNFKEISMSFDDKEFKDYEQKTKEKMKQEIDERMADFDDKIREKPLWLPTEEEKQYKKNEIIDTVKKGYINPLTFLEENSKKLKREYKAASIELDAELWSLLSNNKDTIFNIKDWEVYRRATEISKEIPTEKVAKSVTMAWNYPFRRPGEMIPGLRPI
jgi:hypothetical protein